MELKDLAPWNWFKKEEEYIPPRGTRAEPSQSKEYQPTPSEVEAMNQFFDSELDDHFWSSFSLERPVTPLTDPGLLRPYIDIATNGNEYLISVDVPGVDKEDINIQIKENTLIITGERQQSFTQNDKNFHLVEKSYGAFQRKFTLPDDAAPADMEALYKQGKLLITLPRRT